jgi:predicted NUDIX family NTP pyrophosphohydrolase
MSKAQPPIPKLRINAMPKLSAGLLMYRIRDGRLEVLLAHPGGPFWAKKDQGAWSIPKGEVEPGEDAFSTAKREFEEELGFQPQGEFTELKSIQQKGGKTVQAWAVEGNCDPASMRSNTFLMEWPPRSGKKQEFPEVDRAEFFEISQAKRRINAAQIELLSELEQLLAAR